MSDREITRADIEHIAHVGRDRYAELREMLERNHLGEWAQINTETGEYLIGDTIGELHARYSERFGDAPSWDTCIGYPTRTGTATIRDSVS